MDTATETQWTHYSQKGPLGTVDIRRWNGSSFCFSVPRREQKNGNCRQQCGFGLNCTTFQASFTQHFAVGMQGYLLGEYPERLLGESINRSIPCKKKSISSMYRKLSWYKWVTETQCRKSLTVLIFAKQPNLA